jgi:hypothetical protein
MEDLESKIREDFYMDTGTPPVCYTVQDLIDLLKELPGGLPIHSGAREGANVVVYNVGCDDPHVEISDID